MRTRITARAVVYDRGRDSILLVKSRDTDFWHIPGGGWEADEENILECAKREVKEETGLDVEIGKFLYLQEYHHSSESVIFDTFWLAFPTGDTSIDEDHIDLDLGSDGGIVEKRWFTRGEAGAMELYPEVFRRRFWEDLDDVASRGDRFLGVNFNVSSK